MKRALKAVKRWVGGRTLGQKTAIQIGLLLLFGAVALIGASMDPVNSGLILLGSLGMVAAVVILLIWCRCPHCGEFLQWRVGMEYCPLCGEKLEQ